MAIIETGHKILKVSGSGSEKYYPGDNISISDQNVISSKDWSTDIQNAVNNKQDKLTAGENITIQGNVISAKSGGTLYKGFGLSGQNTQADPLRVSLQPISWSFKSNITQNHTLVESDFTNPNRVKLKYTFPTVRASKYVLVAVIGALKIQRTTEASTSPYSLSIDWMDGDYSLSTSQLGYYAPVNVGDGLQYLQARTEIDCPDINAYNGMAITIYNDVDPLQVGDKVAIDVSYLIFPQYNALS